MVEVHRSKPFVVTAEHARAALVVLDPLETDAVYRELEKRPIEIVPDLLEDGEPAPVRLPAPAPVPLSWETTTDALQLFLREAGRHPLLSAAQEVALAKSIERGDRL